MTKIKIFIASSIVEFKEERDRIQLHINFLNKITKKQGIELKIYRCEETSVAMSIGRSQDNYNELIRNSDFFFMIVGYRLGEFTREEFEIAWEQFNNTGTNPMIYPMFLRKHSELSPDTDVNQFEDYLRNKCGYFPQTFYSIDSILLKITLELLEKLNIGEMDVKDGKAFLHGKEIFSVDDASIYRDSEVLKRIKDDIIKINREFSYLKDEVSEHHVDEKRAELEDIAVKRDKLYSDKHTIEKALFENYSMIVDYNSDTSDTCLKKSMEYMQQGKTKEAINTLCDSQLKKKIEEINNCVGKLREKDIETIQDYLREKDYLVSVIKSTGLDENKIEKINRIYDEVVSTCTLWSTGTDVLYKYAEFLTDCRDYKKAREIVDKIKGIHSICGCTDNSEKVKLYTLSGKIYYEERQETYAEIEYLRVRDLLAKGIYPVIERIKIYNKLSEYYWRAHNYSKAIYYADSARELLDCEDDEMNNDTEFMKEQGFNYSQYGLLNRVLEEYDMAKDYHKKSIEIRRSLKEIDFIEYALPYSASCNDIAFVYKDLNRIDKSIEYINECINIRNELMLYKPSAVKSSIALSYNNLSYFELILGRYKDSLKHAKKAYELRKMLLERNNIAYRHALAMSLRREADALACLNKSLLADEKFNKAIVIWEELADDNFEVYGWWLAYARSEYALFLTMDKKYDKAESYHKKSIMIIDDMQRLNISTYRRGYLKYYVGYIILLIKNKKFDEAKELLRQTISIVERVEFKKDNTLFNAYSYLFAVIRTCEAEILIQDRKYEEARMVMDSAIKYIILAFNSCREAFEKTYDYIKYIYSKAENSDDNNKNEVEAEIFKVKYGIHPEEYVNLLFI